MHFATDRDLMLLEPNVFAELHFIGQQRLSTDDGVLAGVTLTSAAGDFVAAQVDAGSVVLIDNVPHEVLQRIDANTLTVSLSRDAPDGPAIPAADGQSLDLVVRTFQPQAAMVRDELLRILGINPADSAAVSRIVSPDVMRSVHALATLERIYASAFTIGGDNADYFNRAQQYRRRFRQAWNEARLLVDRSGDGQADAIVAMGTAALRRV